MSHYSQNTQSFLTGSFTVLYMIFKSKFGVKNEAKEFRFFDYSDCYKSPQSNFFQKDFRVWKKKRTVGKKKKKPGHMNSVLLESSVSVQQTTVWSVINPGKHFVSG